MRKQPSIQALLSMAFFLMILASCSTHKGLVFANENWHISNHYGQIINRDTTYRMTFGNVLIPDPLAIISSADSVAKYPGMDRFIADILHTCRLDSAEILFYTPHMATMFVKPKHRMPPVRPSSVSSDLLDKNPCTMWVYEDDMEDWNRESTEMYTYTYFNKGKKQILVVDFYDYGDSPIAQIFVFQSNTKSTNKMDVAQNLYLAFYKHDLKKYDKDIEFWSYIINTHRKLAFANYKIGQEQKLRHK